MNKIMLNPVRLKKIALAWTSKPLFNRPPFAGFLLDELNIPRTDFQPIDDLDFIDSMDDIFDFEKLRVSFADFCRITQSWPFLKGDIRLGQYVVNRLNITCPELYYADEFTFYNKVLDYIEFTKDEDC